MKADLAKERLEAVAKRIREIKPMTHDFKYAKSNLRIDFSISKRQSEIVDKISISKSEP